MKEQLQITTFVSKVNRNGLLWIKDSYWEGQSTSDWNQWKDHTREPWFPILRINLELIETVFIARGAMESSTNKTREIPDKNRMWKFNSQQRSIDKSSSFVPGLTTDHLTNLIELKINSNPIFPYCEFSHLEHSLAVYDFALARL